MSSGEMTRQIPWISMGLLLILIVFTPYAMGFRPYPDFASSDSLQPQRAGLILLGLSAATIALFELLAKCCHNRTDAIGLAPFAAAFLACAVVGWRSYPYWATGVYQVDLGAFPAMDQDPKQMIPMLWMGDLWRLVVLLLYPLCYVVVPALLIATFVAFRRRRYVVAIPSGVCTGIVLIFMMGFSPHYLSWLMD
ncbi:hypothetical protein OKA05_22815 [Luteolibacter arcticus]|uniref:Uncharacterized protein n=1 Tax=Luteolibacter arcticus TaxID=1581411 RepID=A0ABT3GPF8_9BACT|nr:hypothetical protein [Luteolibacter arcticus]MCW1925411.1 hypothetical protein [Luteolibacter arcticus]